LSAGRRRLVLACPGDLETRTGGYLYDRRLALELEARGWDVRRLSLPAGFPFPSGAELAGTEAAFAALPAGTTALVDGLALGAMPEIAARMSSRLNLVALVHHPLCLETGLGEEQATALAASERAALARARAVVVTSPSTAASVRDLLGVPAGRLAVAVPGTDAAPVARGSGGRRIVCVGTVTPRKGHLVLVEAMAGLADLDWELFCAGSTGRDPAAAAGVRARVEALGLGDRVRLLGELDPDGLADLYDRADLCVSASFHEGYGMALAEALARGLPIVAAAGGAVADTVPPAAGLLVPTGDAGALRMVLRRFLSEPGLAARLRAGALAARRDLPSWAETAASVERALTAAA
jgi:glycosyltransferase involved in cell wall biosynthesis